MISVKEAKPDTFIGKLKEELTSVKEIAPPEWSYFVKSGVQKERPPEQPDFWYIRTASVLKRVAIDGPVGTERLRSYFGGRKRRGHRPARFRRSSGAIIRRILHQLESAGLIEKDKKGRRISAKGRELLNKISKASA